jgi:putative adhesin
MDLKSLWLVWRRDIIRFVTLCLAAVAVGLLINHAKAGVHDGLRNVLPSGSLDGLTGDLDFDAPPGPRKSSATWTYRARLSPGQSVWVRDMRGSITIGPGRGESLEVAAVRSFSHSDPRSVRLVTVPSNGGVAICALWGGDPKGDGDGDEEGHCGPGDEYKAGSAHNNDVGVEFTVRLPRGVRIRATTVTGSVRVSGATAPVIAGTVDGAVDAETMKGPVQAYSVNGSVHATVRGFSDTGAVKLTTVNGSVTLELPVGLNATVRARTINGAIMSDFPLTTTGTLVAHRASGVIGDGGRRVELNAVNGSVRLKKLVPPTRH